MNQKIVILLIYFILANIVFCQDHSTSERKSLPPWLREDQKNIFSKSTNNSQILSKLEYENFFSKSSNDIKVNENAGDKGADQIFPSIVIGPNDDYLITWLDKRNGKLDLYSRIYSQNSAPKTNFVKITPSNQSVWNYGTDAFFLDTNRILFTWVKDGEEIYAQFYDNTLNKIGSSFVLNQVDYDSYNINNPSIESDCDSSFLVTWSQNNCVMARRFSFDGIPLTDNIKINNDNLIAYYANNNVIAKNDLGQYAIVFSGVKSYADKSKIYLQLLNKDGEKIGENILISDSTITSTNFWPSITKIFNNNFAIVWNERPNDSNWDLANVFYQVYSSSKGKIDGNKPVNELNKNVYADDGKILSNKEGFEIYWLESGVLNYRKFDTLGNSKSETQTLKNNFKNSYYNNYTTLKLKDNLTLVSYSNYQFGNSDVILDKFLNNQFISSFIPYSDNYTSWETNPKIEVCQNGDFIVAWLDKRLGYNEIFAQLFDSNSKPVGQNIRVSNSNVELISSNFTLSSDNFGNYIIAWKSSNNVFIQKISNDGHLINGNIRINEKPYFWIEEIKLTKNDEEKFLISWRGENYSNSGIYARYITKDLVLSEKTFEVLIEDFLFPLNSSKKIYSVNNKWEFCFIYKDCNTNSFSNCNQLKVRLISLNGNIISEIQLNQGIADAKIIDYSLSVNETNQFQAHWLLDAEGYSDYYLLTQPISRNPNFDTQSKIVKRFYNSFYIGQINSDNKNILIQLNNYKNTYGILTNLDFSPIAQTILLSPKEQSTSENYFFHLYNDKLYSCWEDFRETGVGRDIWMNVSNFYDKPIENEANNYSLKQNYPNPFNSHTIITYSLPKKSNVKIEIYNLLGEKVQELINKSQEKGKYQYSFYAGGLPSGIYFYKLITDQFIETKKMVLIK